MMFINNYCTDFMFQEVMVFKISQKFVEFYVYRFKLRNLFINSNKMSYIYKRSQ